MKLEFNALALNKIMVSRFQFFFKKLKTRMVND